MPTDYDPEELYQSTDKVEMRLWLERAEEAIEEGAPKLTDWEQEFIESVREQFDERSDKLRKPFSGKQLVILRKIYDKAVG